MNFNIIFIVTIFIIAIALTILFVVEEDKDEILWIAVGNDDNGSMENILYSRNGIDWKPASMETSGVYPFYNGDGSGVAYNGTNRWVAVGHDFWKYTSNIVYSEDGIKWNKATMAGGGSPFSLVSGSYGRGRGVAYGQGKWVAVGNDAKEANYTSNIIWSTYGKEWNTACMSNGTSPFGDTGGRGRGVAYNGSDRWVAVGFDDGNSTSKILWSSNGTEWNTACMSDGTSPFGTGNGYGVAYGDNLWVAVGVDKGGNTSNILYSSDGLEWNTACMVNGTSAFGKNFPDVNDGSGIAYNGNGRWVAVGYGGTSTSNILYSDDGKQWTNAYMSGGANPFGDNVGNGVAYGDGKWIATGKGGTSTKSILWSNNGIEWKNTNGNHFDIEGMNVAFRSLLPN